MAVGNFATPAFFITNNYFHYQRKAACQGTVISLAVPIFVPHVNQGSRLSSKQLISSRAST